MWVLGETLQLLVDFVCGFLFIYDICAHFTIAGRISHYAVLGASSHISGLLAKPPYYMLKHEHILIYADILIYASLVFFSMVSPPANFHFFFY